MISRDRYWLWLILLLALGLSTYHIAYPTWDYHNWRQTQTLMVARDFARHGFRVLHPQVQWVSSRGPDSPSYFSGEFSIEAILAALLYKLFGENDTLARVVVITFSLLGIIFLYQLLNRLAGPTAARMGAFIYAQLPYHLFFGRVFMPDIPAISLGLGGLAFLSKWTENRKPVTLLAAAVLTALAVLQKLTIAFIGLPILYLFWVAEGRRLFMRSQLSLFTAVATIPAFAWYARANELSRRSGFGFVLPNLFGHHLSAWLRGAFLYRNLTSLWSEAFSPIGLTLAVVGLFWPARDRAFWLFRLWALGAGLLLFLIPDLLSSNYYYLTLLLPGGAALAGLILARFAAKRCMQPVVAVVLAVFAIGAVRAALPLYQDDRAPRDLGVLLNRLTAPEDLIATESGGSPNVLYFADRKGWMLTQLYRPDILQQLANAGAKYYANSFSGGVGERQQFFRAMDARFERLTPDEGAWPIYRLTSSAETQARMTPAETRTPKPLNFADQVEVDGVSLRRFAESPTSFELVFFWRRLLTRAADLRVFIDVTNPAGEKVYHGTFGPGPQATSRRGDLMREQRVVILPGGLPKAKYSIWLGWIRPLGGVRLAVVDPIDGNPRNSVEVGRSRFGGPLGMNGSARNK